MSENLNIEMNDLTIKSINSDDNLCPSPNFNDVELKDQPEEQIFNLIESEDDNDEEIIKEMLDFEFNEKNEDVDKIVLKDVLIILNPQDVVIKKKRNYTEAHKKAQQRYREKFPEKYRELQRKIYNNLKQDEEWKKRFNEKNKETQKKYREKKRQEKILNGEDVKPRGRPRKETEIKNNDAIVYDV